MPIRMYLPKIKKIKKDTQVIKNYTERGCLRAIFKFFTSGVESWAMVKASVMLPN